MQSRIMTKFLVGVYLVYHVLCFVPENEDFISVPDALLYQMEQQHHFGRVLQHAGLVVIHDILCLDM